MSLDVYLKGKKPVTTTCSHCGSEYEEDTYLFNQNITHNLGKMAKEAGIYEALWRPEEIGVEKAEQLIRPLEKAVADMKANPVYYKGFEPSNGWGTYKDFVPWIERYIEACKENPEAEILISR